MGRIYFYTTTFFLLVILTSCGNDKVEDTTSIDTSEMSKEEIFASVMVNEFLKEDDDELQEYLQIEIYPLLANAERIYIEKISTNEYMLTIIDNNVDKKIIITKYFDPVNDQVFFERSDVIIESDEGQD